MRGEILLLLLNGLPLWLSSALVGQSVDDNNAAADGCIVCGIIVGGKGCR